MKKFQILTLILVAVLISFKCKKKEKYVEIEKIGEIVLPLPDTKYNVAYDIQIYQKDTTNWLILYTKSNYLLVYNLNNNTLIKKIDIGWKEIFSFHFQSPDSIFLIYNLVYFNMHCDSLIRMIDTSGRIKKNYAFKDNHFFTFENIIDKYKFYTPHTIFQKIQFHNGKLFFLINRYVGEYYGDQYTRNNNFSNAGYLDVKTGKYHFIDFPKELPINGMYLPISFEWNFLCLSKDNNIMIGYKNTGVMYEYCIKTKKIIDHYVHSSIVDTVKPVKDSNYADQMIFLDNYPSYWNIYYDKFRKVYIRLMYLPWKIYGKREAIMLFDTNFNKIGEGLLPIGIKNPFEFSKDYILMWDKEKTFNNEGYIYFTKCKFNVTDNSVIEELKNAEIKPDTNTTLTVSKNNGFNSNIYSYLTNLIKDKNNFAVLIIPLMESCPACKEYALNLYSANKNTYLNNNVILIIVNEDKVITKSVLEDKNLNFTDSNIITDNSGIYKSFVSTNFYNPRVVIVKNNKVTFDKTYYPQEIEQIPIALDDFINKK